MGIYKVTTKHEQRTDVINYIREKRFKRVVDIGGAMNPWAYLNVKGYIEQYIVVDMNLPHLGSMVTTKFGLLLADLDDSYSWRSLDYDVSTYGMYDFAICTQCLEHVGNIKQALMKISLIAKEGFLSMPSCWTEMSKGVAFGNEGLDRCNLQNHFRGFMPHKWMFTINDLHGDPHLVAIPKLGYMEQDYVLSTLIMNTRSNTPMELSMFWKDVIPNIVVNDAHIDYPDPQKEIEYIRELMSGCSL